MTWIKVASKDDIREGSGKELSINGQRIALFLSKNKYYAIEALCRHQDGSLAPGKVSGEIVECPLTLLALQHSNRRTIRLYGWYKINYFPC